MFRLILLPIALFFTPNISDSSLQYTFFEEFHEINNERYRQTEYGPAIDWQPKTKLDWFDFKAPSKTGKQDAVATSSCGFGLESETKNGETSYKIYVRFYCDESWSNPNVRFPEVLAHEQLHFDICEIYGRKLFKELVKLKKAGKLNSDITKDIYNQMTNTYNNYQDLYDLETEHSTNEEKQKEWNEKVRQELLSLKNYSNYQSF